MTFSASVVIPTCNRPGSITVTLDSLVVAADRAGAEVLVVDDGSAPPFVLPFKDGLRLVRTTGIERSRARNAGACAARSDLLIFIDDDITVAPEFVEQHLRAAEEFGSVIGVGRISLPLASSATPFGRFRKTIEEPSQTRPRGLVDEKNFCTAANMSVRRSDFLSLGGFDPAILSGEDQDLALRFSERGGSIAFLPEADALHRDPNMDIVSYARRHEWGARAQTPFLLRYPDRPENVVRRHVGRPMREARSPAEAVRLLTRMTLSHAWPLGLLRAGIRVLERGGAPDRLLFPLYRALLGLHLFRGFQKGMADTAEAPPLPQPLPAGDADAFN